MYLFSKEVKWIVRFLLSDQEENIYSNSVTILKRHVSYSEYKRNKKLRLKITGHARNLPHEMLGQSASLRALITLFK